MTLFVNFWNLLLESAPWLLLGFLLAGVIKQVIPSRWIESQLARPGFLSVIKGAIIGAPLPLCSCGVIPAALGIRQAGASKGATAAFLVATPETGVDSVSYSLAVLGPVYAIARPLAALVSGLVAGSLVYLTDRTDQLTVTTQACGGCCGAVSTVEPSGSIRAKLMAALRYGYGDMIRDTGKWLAIGLGVAAVINTYVPESFFLRWGDGIGAMLAMVLLGLPMYICATASTPMAAGFLFAGMSPGAALVFLLTGPATNIATMGVIRQQLGGRALLAYLVGVIGTAVLCGLLLNQLFMLYHWPLTPQVLGMADHHPWWRQLAAAVLTGLVLRPPVGRLLARCLGHGQAPAGVTVVERA